MNRVVVTGIGAVTPVGNDIQTMWQNLIEGKVGIDTITKFDCSEFKSKVGAEIKGFEPHLYMDKSDVRRSDLYSQYALASAVQAVEDSGVLNSVAPDRFGVYYGSGIGGINTFITETNKLNASGPRKVSPLFVPMMISNIAAGNIAIRFGAKGPCISVVTACATGSTAIGEALRAIRHGYADVIITGGSDAAINPISVAGFGNMTALTTSDDPLSASLPFDKRRNGFVIGEGAGALILEEYEHAVKRGAKIYAEVSGYGSTCDAYNIVAPDPDGECIARAICDAIAESGGLCGKQLYINAHGTGTPINDVTETNSIKKALGQDAYKALISSTKSMTGHTLGAAGAIEAIIAILTLQYGIVPPTMGLTEPDPECDLDYVPCKARQVKIDLALSNSLGFGGHNTCLAFQRSVTNGI